MPSGNPFPPALLACQFDASQWETGNLLSINGNNISLNALDPLLHEDLIMHLNGRGRSRDNHGGDHLGMAAPLGQLMAAAAAAASPDNWWIDLGGTDDHIQITTDGNPFQITLALPAGNAVWGFSATAITNSVNVGGVHFATTINPWKRGPIGLDGVNPVIQINPSVTAAFLWPIAARGLIYQDIPTFLRRDDERNAGGVLLDIDAQNYTFSLEYRGDLSAADDGHWMIDDEGYVIYATVNGAPFAPTFLNVDYAQYLGFDGSETMVAAAGVGTNYWRGNNRPRGVVRPVWPFERYRPTEHDDTNTGRRANTGELTANTVAQWREWMVRFSVHGPTQPANDLVEHWLDFVRLCPKGRMLSVYPEWGDPRRRGLLRDFVLGQQGPYSRLYNAEENGRRGRMRGRRSDADSSQGWDPEGSMLQRAAVELIVDERPAT